MKSQEKEKDLLFVGLTRPTTFAGVTLEVFLLNGFIGFLAFMLSGKIWYMLVIVPFHIFARLMCAKDPLYFTLLLKKLIVSQKVLNFNFWKASSYSPLIENEQVKSNAKRKG